MVPTRGGVSIGAVLVGRVKVLGGAGELTGGREGMAAQNTPKGSELGSAR